MAHHPTPPAADDALNPRLTRTDDPSATPLAWITVISVLTVVVTVLAVQAFFLYFEEREWERKIVASPYPTLDETGPTLNTLDIIDAEAKTIRLPIQLAMELQAKAIDQAQAQTQPNHHGGR